MGIRVVRWDVEAVLQLAVMFAGAYYLYKRLADDHVLAPKYRADAA